MKRKKKKTQPKTFKWYLDRILRVLVGVLVITGVVLFIVGGTQDNMIMMFVGIGMLPGTGILITPNIVRYSLKDNTDWKSKFRGRLDRLYKAGMLSGVSDMSPYQKKLVRGVRREALLNFSVLVVVLAVILVANFLLIKNGDGDNEGISFILIVGVVTFGIPISAYNIGGSVYRIRTVKNCKYNAYRTVVSGADRLNMWIIEPQGAVHTFEYCRCLGIRSKNVHNTKAILVFVPDEVYLLPEQEEPSDKG